MFVCKVFLGCALKFTELQCMSFFSGIYALASDRTPDSDRVDLVFLSFGKERSEGWVQLALARTQARYGNTT